MRKLLVDGEACIGQQRFIVTTELFLNETADEVSSGLFIH